MGHEVRSIAWAWAARFSSVVIALGTAPVAAQATFFTYAGGAAEETCRDVVFDAAGNLYATGGTESSGFMTTDGTTVNPGAAGAGSGPHDAWVRKYSPTGELLWSTVIGGRGYDRAYAIEVNDTGVYIAGRAGIGFPTTSGAFQTSFGGDSSPESFYGEQDGFVARLSHDGAVQWATYVGGAGREIIRDFDVDATGSVLAGVIATGSVPFVTAGAFDTSPGAGLNAVIARLAPDGRSVVWATYLGGTGDDGINPSVRVDPTTGNVLVAAHGHSTDFPTTAGAYDRSPGGASDVTLTAIRSDGSGLVFSTYIGGSGDELIETHGLAVMGDRVVVACTTTSSDLPTTAGVHQPASAGGADGFVALFDGGGAHVATTYFGGGNPDWIEGVGLFADGSVAVTGGTDSAGFPPLSTGTLEGSGREAFVAVLSADLTATTYGERVGGALEDNFRTAAVDPITMRIGVGGLSHSTDFPVTDGSMYRSTGSSFDGRDVIVGWVTLAGAPVCSDGETRSCYGGPGPTRDVGECMSGTQTCAAGAWGACAGERVPRTERCDGLDDDCDGSADEDWPALGAACSAGLGACAASGTTACSADGSGATCDAEVGTPTEEVCDGAADEDCDGSIDDGCSCSPSESPRECYAGPDGTRGVGTCAAGSQACTDGTWDECAGQVLPASEVCDDGLDNDCDGLTDRADSAACMTTNPDGGVSSSDGGVASSDGGPEGTLEGGCCSVAPGRRSSDLVVPALVGLLLLVTRHRVRRRAPRT